MSTRPLVYMMGADGARPIECIERDLRASWAKFNADMDRAQETAGILNRADKFGQAVERWADTVPVQYADELPELPPITMTAWERAVFWLQDHRFTAGLLTGMWIGAALAWARFA